MRHGAEEFISDEATDHRKTLRKRIDEPGDHVVAVDRKSAIGPAPCRATDRARYGVRCIEQRAGKGILDIGQLIHDVRPSVLF